MKITSKITRQRKLAALICVPSAAALAVTAGLAIVIVNGPMVQPAHAEPVTNCLGLRDGRLFNGCSFSVEAVWCTENIDCNDGRFTNRGTIYSMQGRTVQGGNSGNTVRWGACRGVNTISTHETTAYSWEYYCTD